MCKVGAIAINAAAYLGFLLSPQASSAQGFERCPEEAIENYYQYI